MFFGSDDGWDEAQKNLDRNEAMYDLIGLPTYKEYVPELYQSESANYELINEDPVLKSRQLSVLNQLAGLSNTGLSGVDEAAFMKARNEAGNFARGRNQALMQEAQARGVSGSGLEFGMRESANQEAAQRAQQAGLEQAAQAARQRALYTQAYGDALAGVRTQDARTAGANTDIINRFNQANTAQRNSTNQANVDQRNTAFMYNEGLKDKNYQNQLARADRKSGVNNQSTELALAQMEQNRKRRAALGSAIGAGVGAIGGAAGSAAGAQIGGTLGGY